MRNNDGERSRGTHISCIIKALANCFQYWQHVGNVQKQAKMSLLRCAWHMPNFYLLRIHALDYLQVKSTTDRLCRVTIYR